jgi:putative transposase
MDPCYPERKKLNHSTPGWVEGPEYFITICCEDRRINSLCHPMIGQIILNSSRNLNSKGIWQCELLLLMPDHLHLLATFSGKKSMEAVITLWKRWLVVHTRVKFQRGFFDHRLRSVYSSCEKWAYINLNPVRRGLINDPLAWPYRWTQKDLNLPRHASP